MTALSELTVDDLADRQAAQDRLITWLMRERNLIRTEIARRDGRPVTELFPSARHRSRRQNEWTDADRALHATQAELDKLRAFIAECPRCSVAVAA